MAIYVELKRDTWMDPGKSITCCGKERIELTNMEIIANAAVGEGMYSLEEALWLLENDEEIKLHTLQCWNRQGDYQVKEGEKGIEVKLWKKKEEGSGFYKTKAFLYKRNQLQDVAS